MQKPLFFLLLIFVAHISFAQSTDCSQGNGTFKYRAILTENIAVDFDKEDFLDFISVRDNISNQDLNILTQGITAVYRTIPSINLHKSVTIDSTIDIYSILDSLENSIDMFYCVVRDCIQKDETYAYFATLIEGPVANNFSKADFIAYISARDVISNADLAILTEHITTVFKAFPSSQSDFLKRTIVINVAVDIYGILESLSNSLEYFECIDDTVILALTEMPIGKSAIVYPNPITEHSVVKLDQYSQNLRLEITNLLGQQLYSALHSGAESIALKNLPIPTGISFLRIYHLADGRVENLKLLKEE